MKIDKLLWKLKGDTESRIKLLDALREVEDDIAGVEDKKAISLTQTNHILDLFQSKEKYTSELKLLNEQITDNTNEFKSVLSKVKAEKIIIEDFDRNVKHFFSLDQEDVLHHEVKGL